jgi:hypothetical protein
MCTVSVVVSTGLAGYFGMGWGVYVSGVLASDVWITNDSVTETVSRQ